MRENKGPYKIQVLRGPNWITVGSNGSSEHLAIKAAQSIKTKAYYKNCTLRCIDGNGSLILLM